jgi:hypothetical protein
MPKYTFSQGRVEVEEGIYLPPPHKDRHWARAGVLIVIPSHPHAKGYSESTPNMDKENPYGKQQ